MYKRQPPHRCRSHSVASGEIGELIAAAAGKEAPDPVASLALPTLVALAVALLLFCAFHLATRLVMGRSRVLVLGEGSAHKFTPSHSGKHAISRQRSSMCESSEAILSQPRTWWPPTLNGVDSTAAGACDELLSACSPPIANHFNTGSASDMPLIAPTGVIAPADVAVAKQLLTGPSTSPKVVSWPSLPMVPPPPALVTLMRLQARDPRRHERPCTRY